ncbi:MAG: methionyl-tRNA formyltransferase [Candidatus Shikimatogenerans bostrichidophilus]|nr:MAG: methionyl-tRNA formyltransferase [Candidatus Shikimatogenerans bostrichidophilus]
MNKIKIIFMGNGDFGYPCLIKLINNKKYKIACIITSKKKKINNKKNLILSIAKKKKIKIIYTENINKIKYINKIKKIKPDLQILISFKIIKKKIWKIPKLGTINIHPSLLPNYRGPCPINWVIINGEKETGLTSFFVNDKIDKGKIIIQKKIKIKNINFEKLYYKLSIINKKFIIKTINIVLKKNIKLKKNKISKYNLSAPKINNFYSKIFLNEKIENIYNKILGLSKNKPAWCFLNTKKKIFIINIYKSKIIKINKNLLNIKIGKLIFFKKKILIKVKDGFINLLICQLNNRKKMNIINLYNGIKNKKKIFLF